MIETNRCTACGYLHVGPAPERCPMCGAPQTAFKPFEGVSGLEGTRTMDNLAAAFAGESQANRRYTLWKRIAELEGAPESAIKAFERAAAEETAHALSHLTYMFGATATADNLGAAAQGEENEATDMYPSFAQIAEDEGFPDIAFYFRNVGRFEGQHREEYKTGLTDLESA